MKVQNAGRILEKMIHIAWQHRIRVVFVPFKTCNGRIKVKQHKAKLGIRAEMSLDEYVSVMAHELAHYYLHFDMDILALPTEQQEIYEKQVDRAARMLLDALAVE